MVDTEKFRQWTEKAKKEYGLKEEQLRELIAEAEKESRLKAERAGCGTPACLFEAMSPNMEIEQYLGKKNRD